MILLASHFEAPSIQPVIASRKVLAEDLAYDAGLVDSKQAVRPDTPEYVSGMEAEDLIWATGWAAERTIAPHGCLVLSFDSVVSRNVLCQVLAYGVDFFWAGIPLACVPFRATQHLRAVPGTDGYATDAHLRCVHRLLVLGNIFHPIVPGKGDNFGKDLFEDWINYRFGWPSPRDEERTRFFQARAYPNDCFAKRDFKRRISEVLTEAWRAGRLRSDRDVDAVLCEVVGVRKLRRRAEQGTIEAEMQETGERVSLVGAVFRSGFSPQQVERALERLWRIPPDEVEETFQRVRSERIQRNRARLNLGPAWCGPSINHEGPNYGLTPRTGAAGGPEQALADLGGHGGQIGEELETLAGQIKEMDDACRDYTAAGEKARPPLDEGGAGERGAAGKAKTAGEAVGPGPGTNAGGGEAIGGLGHIYTGNGGAVERPLDGTRAPLGAVARGGLFLAPTDRADGLFAQRDQDFAYFVREIEALLADRRRREAAAQPAHAGSVIPNTGSELPDADAAALEEELGEALARRIAGRLSKEELNFSPSLLARDAVYLDGDGFTIKDEWLHKLSPAGRERLEARIRHGQARMEAARENAEKGRDRDFS